MLILHLPVTLLRIHAFIYCSEKMASGWLGLTGPNFLPVPQRSIWSQNERMTTHLRGAGAGGEGGTRDPNNLELKSQVKDLVKLRY